MHVICLSPRGRQAVKQESYIERSRPSLPRKPNLGTRTSSEADVKPWSFAQDDDSLMMSPMALRPTSGATSKKSSKHYKSSSLAN